MLAIGIVTITKAFELVLIIQESHSSMEVFLGPCFCLAIPLRIVSLFFFFFGFFQKLKQVLDEHLVYKTSYATECRIISFFLVNIRVLILSSFHFT